MPTVNSTLLHPENFVKRIDLKLSVLIAKKGRSEQEGNFGGDGYVHYFGSQQ